jgi:UDP-glucose 4-epimerase
VILEHAHIGSQRSISILDLAQRVVEMTRSESGLRYVPYEEVYELGIEDMYHRVPATRRSRPRSGGGRRSTSTSSSPT